MTSLFSVMAPTSGWWKARLGGMHFWTGWAAHNDANSLLFKVSSPTSSVSSGSSG